eukprot:SAG31_NODE_22791_length_517_cov_2.971292_1_plen_85_part_00
MPSAVGVTVATAAEAECFCPRGVPDANDVRDSAVVACTVSVCDGAEVATAAVAQRSSWSALSAALCRPRGKSNIKEWGESDLVP